MEIVCGGYLSRTSTFIQLGKQTRVELDCLHWVKNSVLCVVVLLAACLQPAGLCLTGCMSGQSEQPCPPPRDSMVSVFFDADGMQRMLTFLCNARLPGHWDPVTSTVVDMLTGRLQFCLTSEGLAPFRGKADMVFPYHMMSARQKGFLRDELSARSAYCVCNDALVFHPVPGSEERLDHVKVLEGVCSRILASGIHSEHRVRVGVCNIILQRVQSVVPLSRGVQQKLNAVLFGPAECEAALC